MAMIRVKVSQEFDGQMLLNNQADFERFGHLVREAHITIPYAIPPPNVEQQRVSLWPAGFQDSLKKFTHIERATIEFRVENTTEFPVENSCSGPLIRWRGNSCGFILLHAQKMVADTRRKPTLLTSTEMTAEEKLALSDLKAHCLSDLKFRAQHMKDLVDILPNIKKIRGVDSEKRGTLVLKDEATAHFRIKIPGVREVTDLEDVHRDVLRNKTWKAFVVKLPRTGLLMEDVFLDLSRDENVSDESIVKNCFEETNYSQLAMELSKTEACMSNHSFLGQFYFADF